MSETTWVKAPGFWGIEGINNQRAASFEKAHAYDENWKKQDAPVTLERVVHWMGHKALTIVSLPTNVIGAGVGLLGMYPVAWVLTAIKACVWLVSEEYAEKLRSGRVYFEDATKHSLGHLNQNISEVLREKVELVKFIFGRLEKGWNAACEKDVANKTWLEATPYPVTICNDFTKESRIDFSLEDRSMADIGKHTVYSFVNIPVNSTAAVCGAFATAFFGTLFIAKTLVFAGTNYDIPLSTYTLKSLDITLSTANNVRIDLRDGAYDGAAALLKAAQLVKIHNLLAKAKEFWGYISDSYWEKDLKKEVIS